MRAVETTKSSKFGSKSESRRSCVSENEVENSRVRLVCEAEENVRNSTKREEETTGSKKIE